MKNYKNYLGFDVSKNTLDYCLLIPQRDTVKRGSVANEKKSLQTLFAAFSKEGLMMEDTLVVFEHTGIYSTILAVFLCGNGWNYAEVPAIEIKRSRGLSRGKSDTIDAQEIAKYAMRNEDKIQLSEVPEIIYQQLNLMNAEREKLIAAIKSFERTSEGEEFLGKEVYRSVKSANRKTVTFLKSQLKTLELAISKLVRSDEDLNAKQELLRSIPGVGEIGTLYLLLTTKGFLRFRNARKYACYCGIAPFGRTSGTSIRGKSRVSPFADKKMKSILHLLSLTAIKYDHELKLYYERKQAEGKPKMLALNNVKFKLVNRIFAVIERGTPYVKTQQFAT